MLKWAHGANELFPSEKVELVNSELKLLARKPRIGPLHALYHFDD